MRGQLILFSSLPIRLLNGLVVVLLVAKRHVGVQGGAFGDAVELVDHKVEVRADAFHLLGIVSNFFLYYLYHLGFIQCAFISPILEFRNALYELLCVRCKLLDELQDGKFVLGGDFGRHCGVSQVVDHHVQKEFCVY